MTPGGRPTLAALGDADDALDSAGQYFAQFAAAYVRGKSAQIGEPFLAPDLASKDLLDLTPPEIAAILEAGRNASLKLHYFKSGHAELPRCRRAIGILRSIMPTSLLDVGSGRGTFLWPCLDAFPDLRAHSVDLLSHRTQVLDAVRRGGVHRLSAETGDFCAMSFPAGAYEVVTLLEVLEHMREPAAAVRNAVNAASRQVVVSVPSKPDSNPEHIHLLTKNDLTQLFQQAGCARLRFDGVAQVSHLAPRERTAVDEAGMLDQGSAIALLAVYAEAGATVALVGNRAQLPAVGRGGVLEIAAQVLGRTFDMASVHRFNDPAYAELTLAMRDGSDPAAVFDQLARRGLVRQHTDDDALRYRMAAAHAPGAAVTAATNEEAALVNERVRAERVAQGLVDDTRTVAGCDGLPIGTGDVIQTLFNDSRLGGEPADLDRPTSRGRRVCRCL